MALKEQEDGLNQQLWEGEMSYSKQHEQVKLFKGELRPEISLLHMKVLTMIKAKSNVFLWYVQCCSCTQRSKTKILMTRAPPSWIEFDVVTSQRQTRNLEYDLWLLIFMFLCLLISCKSQKNRLRVSRGITQLKALWVWCCDVKLNPRWRRPSHQYFGFRSSCAATALQVPWVTESASYRAHLFCSGQCLCIMDIFPWGNRSVKIWLNRSDLLRLNNSLIMVFVFLMQDVKTKIVLCIDHLNRAEELGEYKHN